LQDLEVGNPVLDCICANESLFLHMTPFYVAAQNSLGGRLNEQIKQLKALERCGIEVSRKAADCAVCAAPFATNIGLGCAHTICEVCWARWLDEQLPSCKFQRHLRLPCIGCANEANAAHPLVVRMSQTQKFSRMDILQALTRRHKLQANPLFPAEQQVDCPQEDCVGLGYLGSDTVMCFVCEHQWVHEAQCVQQESDDPNAMPAGIKKCPNCGMLTEKNGGCDHMTCKRCRHEYWWTTLRPYRLGGA
jgi:ariadne-1